MTPGGSRPPRSIRPRAWPTSSRSRRRESHRRLLAPRRPAPDRGALRDGACDGDHSRCCGPPRRQLTVTPSVVDPRLVAALEQQLRARDDALRRGAHQVGWKLGLGNRESIGGHIAVGYLTSETVVPAGSTYAATEDADLHADAEAVVALGTDVASTSTIREIADAILTYGAALEIVDLARLPGEPESVVAGNIFHRAVALTTWPDAPRAAPEVTVSVNRRGRQAGLWPGDVPERIARAAELLGAVGERFQAGDRIITGSIVQVPIGIGDEVVAEFEGHASIRLNVIARGAGRS